MRGLTVVVAALLIGVPVSVQAQRSGESEGASSTAGSKWFPKGRLFSPLIAAPREVGFRGSFVLADRELQVTDFPGRNIEAEVVLGHTIPVFAFSEADEDSPAVTLNFEVATYSRFFMERSTKDLINTDFRVGFPIEFRQNDWSGRVNLRHISAHFGDDFITAFGITPLTTSKDGIEALIAREFGELRVYGGGDYNFHINPGISRAEGRVGLEWDGSKRPDAPSTWVFAAGDVAYMSFSEEVAGTFSAGFGFLLNDREILLEARAHFGPSPMGQMREIEETFFGLGLRVKP